MSHWTVALFGFSGSADDKPSEPENVMTDTFFGLTFKRENYPGASKER